MFSDVGWGINSLTDGLPAIHAYPCQACLVYPFHKVIYLNSQLIPLV